MCPSLTMGAITVQKKSSVVKKAEPVASSSDGGGGGVLASATSLLPGVINLVTGIQQLKKAQQELTAECMPSSSDLSTVNELVKEWAKISDTNAAGATGSLGGERADSSYENCMESADKDTLCYEVFKDGDGYVWDGFPKASSAKLSNKKNVSNVYDVFGKIPFGPEDYTKSEVSKVKNLMEKMEKCAPGKISQKKRELWGGFITNTIQNIGGTTGAAGIGDVVGAVQSMGGSSNVSGVFSSFGSMALKSFDK